MKILILFISIIVAGYSYSEESKFCVRGVSFNEEGFPIEVKIRLYLNVEKNFRPDQMVISGNVINSRGLKDLKLIKRNDVFSVYEFLLNLDDYGEGSIVYLDFLNGWELLKISGPFIKVTDTSGFVCIVQSGTWMAGFTVGETNNEEFHKKVAGVAQIKSCEQAGADQPATAPKPKSERNEKPKPESEERPR